MRTHMLKTWPAFYQAIIDGTKTFEVREDDRAYAVGDTLQLCEWEPEEMSGRFTNREAFCLVTYVMPGGRFGIAPNTVVMGIKLVKQETRSW